VHIYIIEGAAAPLSLIDGIASASEERTVLAAIELRSWVQIPPDPILSIWLTTVLNPRTTEDRRRVSRRKRVVIYPPHL
jgi:hypothetical protein